MFLWNGLGRFCLICWGGRQTTTMFHIKRLTGRREEECGRVFEFLKKTPRIHFMNTKCKKWWHARTKRLPLPSGLVVVVSSSVPFPGLMNEWKTMAGPLECLVMDRDHYKPISSGYWGLTSVWDTGSAGHHRRERVFVCVCVCVCGRWLAFLGRRALSPTPLEDWIYRFEMR